MGDGASLTIAAQCIFDGNDMRGPGSVRISQGRIESVTFGEPAARAAIQLPADVILAPGFIDVQVNGGGGVLLLHGCDISVSLTLSVVLARFPCCRAPVWPTGRDNI